VSGPRPDVVAVVIPVHNEVELLHRCLAALDRAVVAAAERGIRCVVSIVLDECTDGSAAVAAAHPFPCSTIAASCVGAARAHGVAGALATIGATSAERVWIACSDADSAVPENWIILQHDLAAQGADVFVGTVRPDFADLDGPHQRLWLSTHRRGMANGHVHGASLGIRASTYVAAGGFAPADEHEDVDLVARCRQLGATVRASDDAEVLTSGRFVGRTPGGYARFLRTQAEALRTENALGELAS
jgi:GT2 family glycosyltransferase